MNKYNSSLVSWNQTSEYLLNTAYKLSKGTGRSEYREYTNNSLNNHKKIQFHETN